MNHFAHIFLAQSGVESRVGNLLGDFARGVDTRALSPGVYNGLINHRAVDAFTDQHPLVRGAKSLFSAQRRRFAGVALDVLFDHYLIRHWSRFSNQDRYQFTQAAYGDLSRGQPLMPPGMQRTIIHMVDHDWFEAYASLDTIGYALDRVAGRIRFANRFLGIIEEIRAHDAELEAVFLEFFPQLAAEVNVLGLEQKPVPRAYSSKI